MFLLSWYMKPVPIYIQQSEVVKTLAKASLALTKIAKLR